MHARRGFWRTAGVVIDPKLTMASGLALAAMGEEKAGDLGVGGRPRHWPFPRNGQVLGVRLHHARPADHLSEPRRRRGGLHGCGRASTKADVFGYSMGAAAGLQLAIRHPEKVNKLVAASGAYDAEGLQPEFKAFIPQMKVEMFVAMPFAGDYRKLAANPDGFPELVEKLIALEKEPMAWEKDVKAMKTPGADHRRRRRRRDPRTFGRDVPAARRRRHGRHGQAAAGFAPRRPAGDVAHRRHHAVRPAHRLHRAFPQGREAEGDVRVGAQRGWHYSLPSRPFEGRCLLQLHWVKGRLPVGTHVRTDRAQSYAEKRVSMLPNAIEVVTLFVEDIGEAKAFYQKVFAPEVVYQDDVSSVLKFSGAMINLLQATQAPQLVEPSTVALSGSARASCSRSGSTDVDAVCAKLRGLGVALLNGPVDRPWGRRTAAFADPSGHVWEVAQELGQARAEGHLVALSAAIQAGGRRLLRRAVLPEEAHDLGLLRPCLGRAAAAAAGVPLRRAASVSSRCRSCVGGRRPVEEGLHRVRHSVCAQHDAKALRRPCRRRSGRRPSRRDTAMVAACAVGFQVREPGIPTAAK